jgi:hypothetical protein
MQEVKQISIDGTHWRALVIKAEATSGRGLFFSKTLCQEIVEKCREDVEGRRMLGMLEQPSDQRIHFATVSHVVRKIEFDGEHVWIELELLQTPSGRALRSLLESVPNSVVFRPQGTRTGGSINSKADLILNGYSIVSFNAEFYNPSTVLDKYCS